MSRRSRFALLFGAGAVGLACNAVLGLEEVTKLPPPDGQAADAGTGGSSANGGTAGTSNGKGGSGTAGSGAGGSAGTTGSGGDAGETTSGSGAGGSSGDGSSGETSVGGDSGAGGEDTGPEPECTPDEERECRDLDAGLLGNCGLGAVVCGEDGFWGPCSVEAADEDSCATEGDDADCDGTANGGCPCVTGTTRPCGPTSEDGICEFGVSTCVDEEWQPCEGETLPAERDCQSSDDNDCDGDPDNVIDDECPCDSDGEHRCVADAPPDWSGPVALGTAAATASSPSCTATGYERQVLTKFGEVDEGDAECGCTCGAPGNMACSGTPGFFRTTTNRNCALIGITISDTISPTVPFNTCVSMTPGTTPRLKAAGPNFSSNGSCPAQATDEIEDPRFTRRMVACETNDEKPDGCSSDQVCVPNLVTPLQKFCVYQEGENDCPAGTPFTQRTVYYDDLDDGRSCSQCSCGTPTGSCPGAISLTRNPQSPECVGQILIASVSYGGCYDLTQNAIAVSGPSTPTGSCTPVGGQLDGSVTTSGATTLCCEP